MYKYLIFILLLSISFFSCNSTSTKTQEDPFDDEVIDIDKLIGDSLKKSRHQEINDSLIACDKDRIVGDLYLRMPKDSVWGAMEKLIDKENHEIEIAGLDFLIYGNSMVFDNDNKLVLFSVKTSLDIYVNLNYNDPSKTRVIDPTKEYIKKITNYMSKKYGSPDSILNEKGKECNIINAKYVFWNFTTRRIEILSKDGDLFINIVDPHYYTKEKELADSININKQRKEQLQRNIKKEYGRQL